MKEEKDTYTQEWKEYQDKQYTPGYYVGGKFPLALKYPTKKLGFALVVISVAAITTSIFSLVSSGGSPFDFGQLAPIMIEVLALIVGLRFILKKS